MKAVKIIFGLLSAFAAVSGVLIFIDLAPVVMNSSNPNGSSYALGHLAARSFFWSVVSVALFGSAFKKAAPLPLSLNAPPIPEPTAASK